MTGDNDKYPRVLILGNSFDECTGAGVTLTNLFKNWPVEKIAVAAFNINTEYCVKERPCKAYYYFEKDKNIIKDKEKSASKDAKYNGFKSLLKKTGVQDLRKSYNLSDDFLDFFDSFNPAIVYSALGNISIMRFVLELQKKRSFHLVVHIWDDFLERFNNRICSHLWKDYADSLFKKILKSSDVTCIAIGSMMAEEYKKRYKREFSYFHNPVDPDLWIHLSRQSNTTPVISYFGKININTIEALVEMSRAVEKINEESAFKVVFEIHSGSPDKEFNNAFVSYKHTQICPLIPRSDIPKAFISSDLLFYPISFDKDSVKYQRLSIHTKLTEYLISKVPILAYCSPELAVYKYLKDNNAALFCNKGVDNLKKIIVAFLSDSTRGDIVKNNAFKLAMERHTTNHVREAFRAVLCGEKQK